jgi:hypothetical protein
MSDGLRHDYAARPHRTRHNGSVTGSGRPVLLVLVLSGLPVLLMTGVPARGQSESFVSGLLRQHRFSTADLRALRAGEAVVKSLDTPVRREIAHFGVVYVETSPDRFIERFRDIERFERGPGIPQIGRFGALPAAGDLASLSLPAPDIAALAKCRPADCNLKLTPEAIARFRSEVDWSAPDAAVRANDVARGMLLDVVREYQKRGNDALGHYVDHDDSLSVAEEFGELLASGTPVPMPHLTTYLQHYPRGRPDGAEDFFYWSMVEFGLKPTVRVNQVIIQPMAARPDGLSHVIAIKQLYATHYFQTALELRFLIEERLADRPGFYLVSLTRSRIDGTGGLRGAILRSVVNRRSRTAVRGYLEHLKKQVERGGEPG